MPTVHPKDGGAIFFVVEADRSRLGAQRLKYGRLKPNVGAVRSPAEAPTAFAPDRCTSPKADNTSKAVPLMLPGSTPRPPQ